MGVWSDPSHQDDASGVSGLLLEAPTVPCGDGGWGTLPLGERGAEEAGSPGHDSESAQAGTHLAERPQERQVRRGAFGQDGQGGHEIAQPRSASRGRDAGCAGSAEGAGLASSLADQTHQPRTGNGEELRLPDAEMRGRSVPSEDEGAGPRVAPGSTASHLRDSGGVGEVDGEAGPAHRSAGEEVHGRRGSFAAVGCRSADSVGIRSDTGGPGTLCEESRGGRLRGPDTEAGPIRRNRQTAAHHEGGGCLHAPALGERGQLHPQGGLAGQRPQALRGKACSEGREECAQAREGGCGEEAGGADAPALGDGRGVRAPEKCEGHEKGNRRRIDKTDIDLRGAHVKRDTLTRNNEPPRPSDCACRLGLSSSRDRRQRSAGSDPNVHRAPQRAPRECGWKHGGAGLSLTSLTTPTHYADDALNEVGLDLERPPHGRRHEAP